MSDILLITAGLIGIATACGHAIIGETLLLRPLQGTGRLAKRALRGVFQLSTIYWVVGGLLLIATPFLDVAWRQPVVIGVAFLYAVGAMGNLWITHGRHYGWVLLTLATTLAVLGV